MRPQLSCLIDTISVLGRRWQLRDCSGYEHPGANFAATRLQGKVAFTRGCGPDQVEGLLDPSLRRHMPDPFVLTDMEPAAKRIAAAVQSNERILIFGDYDVDGATSTAILQRFLRMAGAANVVTLVPDRDSGYGFGEENFLQALELHPDLIILCDCGTMNHDTVERARNAGIDVIVVDHHQPSDTLPSALALVNPHRADESSEGQKLRTLCTAGLAFMLATAVNRELRNAGRYTASEQPHLATLLDLVALGTVADVMKLVDLNRSFVSLGLRHLNQRRNPGLAALASVAGVKDGATATALGFHLGPRINAGGRIGKARLGADLLASDDPEECAAIADELNCLNHERRDIENAVLSEASQLVRPEDAIIVVAGRGWHHGVIGIVAGRLKETFNRPTIVIGIDENGVGKGSGRSITGVDLGRAVMDAVQAGHLIAGGGHVMACGLTIDPAKLDDFRSYITERLADLAASARDQNSTLLDDAIFTSDLTKGFVDELEQLGPYGQGWPKPRFLLGPARVEGVTELRGGHYKFRIVDENGSVDAMAFRATETGLAAAIASGRQLMFAGQAEVNSWRGEDRIQLMVDDIMMIEPSQPARFPADNFFEEF